MLHRIRGLAGVNRCSIARNNARSAQTAGDLAAEPRCSAALPSDLAGERELRRQAGAMATAALSPSRYSIKKKVAFLAISLGLPVAAWAWSQPLHRATRATSGVLGRRGDCVAGHRLHGRYTCLAAAPPSTMHCSVPRESRTTPARVTEPPRPRQLTTLCQIQLRRPPGHRQRRASPRTECSCRGPCRMCLASRQA